MISVGPIPLFADTVGEITYPVVRDMDPNMYERQHGGDMEVGSYAHRPILVPPERSRPTRRQCSRRPRCPLPRTTSTHSSQAALELMPEILGDEKVGIRYAINGLISMTPDGHPLLGETPEVKGLWSVAASWIKEGPGFGRAVAELMSGDAPVDVHEADVATFYDHRGRPAYPSQRGREGYNKMYGIVHPASSGSRSGQPAASPVYDQGASSAPSSSRPRDGNGPLV